ncbi:hypothetical protein [Shewanella algidipiscicola]|uniref:Uncharacterized protein n=1 Tax=Shewanella algidipiscicola TaxID=614070 RepID=A0ABQ4NTC3_9GAMM|nr:hypothetical protein [Shewanella algidipiscicola]GIU02820.1 hypothetical protein TUM4630_35240 [Shewanella algidipiscicola]
MLYQQFEQAISLVKKPEQNPKSLQEVIEKIVCEMTKNGASGSTLKLFKYLFLRTRRNSNISFFSDSVFHSLKADFQRDPSDFTLMFVYSLAIFERDSNSYLLEKLLFSAWKNKAVVEEVLRELKVYG